MVLTVYKSSLAFRRYCVLERTNKLSLSSGRDTSGAQHSRKPQPGWLCHFFRGHCQWRDCDYTAFGYLKQPGCGRDILKFVHDDL